MYDKSKPVRFIHIKKNGGTSSYKFLRKNGVNILVGDSKEGLIRNHNPVSVYKKEHSYKICIKRNPYTRVVSFYNWIKRDGGYNWLTFPTYIRDMYNSGRGYNSWKLQTDYMYHNEKLLIDKIFSFENLENELRYFFNIDKRFPHLNKGTYRDHMSYYFNDELKEIVYNRFKKDFEVLGYEHDEF